MAATPAAFLRMALVAVLLIVYAFAATATDPSSQTPAGDTLGKTSLATERRGLKLEVDDDDDDGAAAPADDAPLPVDSPSAADGPATESDGPPADAPPDQPAEDAPAGEADAPPLDEAPPAKTTTSPPSPKGSTQRVGSPAVPGKKVSLAAASIASGLLLLLLAF